MTRLFKSVPNLASSPETPKEVDTTGISCVWVHYREGGNRDQLRYSVRSVSDHLKGVRNYVICGDIPWWYKGGKIPSPRVTMKQAARLGAGEYQKHCDSVVKLRKIIDSKEVTDDFLWLYDDTYIMGPMELNLLRVPRAKGKLYQIAEDLYEPVRHQWHEVMRQTCILLRESELPEWNYSTHYPVVYNKQKLTEVLDKFQLPSRPVLIESLYLNYLYPDPDFMPDSINGWFQYTKSPGADWSPLAMVVNVGEFNAAVQPVMASRFGRKCPLEVTAEMNEFRYRG